MEQLETRGPALGPACQRGELLGGQRLAVEVPVELLHLPGAEPQVVDADLQQLARDLEAWQVHVRPDPAGRHDGERRGHELDEPLQASLRVRRLQGVEVVDDQERVVGEPLLERRHGVLDRLPAATQPGDRSMERLLQVPEHPDRVPIPAVGAVPRHGTGRGAREASEQGGLAGTGGCDDKGQAVVPGEVQGGVKARDGQAPGPGDADPTGGRGQGHDERRRGPGGLLPAPRARTRHRPIDRLP